MRTLAFVLLAAAAAADSSGPGRPGPREWRDEEGRVIRRLDGWGRMLFYTYGQNNVVEISLAGGRVHRFLHGPSGLEAEIDCWGRRHDFSSPRVIDLLAGTALEGHRHPPAVLPPAPTSPAVWIEYDASGRLTSSRVSP